jgi:hypothetical protein
VRLPANCDAKAAKEREELQLLFWSTATAQRQDAKSRHEPPQLFDRAKCNDRWLYRK